MKVASLEEWKARRRSQRSTKRVCPACKCEAVFRPSRPRGFVERTIFQLFGWRYFRCGECGERFHWAERTTPSNSETGELGATLRCVDQKDFMEVIRELERAEKGLSSHARHLAVIRENGTRDGSDPSVVASRATKA